MHLTLEVAPLIKKCLSSYTSDTHWNIIHIKTQGTSPAMLKIPREICWIGPCCIITDLKYPPAWIWFQNLYVTNNYDIPPVIEAACISIKLVFDLTLTTIEFFSIDIDLAKHKILANIFTAATVLLFVAQRSQDLKVEITENICTLLQ